MKSQPKPLIKLWEWSYQIQKMMGASRGLTRGKCLPLRVWESDAGLPRAIEKFDPGRWPTVHLHQLIPSSPYLWVSNSGKCSQTALPGAVGLWQGTSRSSQQGFGRIRHWHRESLGFLFLFPTEQLHSACFIYWDSHLEKWFNCLRIFENHWLRDNVTIKVFRKENVNPLTHTFC